MKLLIVFAILTFSTASQAGHFLDEALKVIMNISSGGTYSSYLEGRIKEIELEGEKRLAELNLYLSQKNKAYDKTFLQHHREIATRAKENYQKQKISVDKMKVSFVTIYQMLLEEFVNEERILLLMSLQELYQAQKQNAKTITEQLDITLLCQQEQRTLCAILSKYEAGENFDIGVHKEEDVAKAIVMIQDFLTELTRAQIEVNIKYEKYKSMEESILEQMEALK